MVVMMGAEGSVDTAVRCMSEGAFDYLLKPFSNEQVEIILRKTEQFAQVINVNQFLTQQEAEDTENEILGGSPPSNCGSSSGAAQTDATVLIQGENGTGKELVARAYKNSSRKDGPFIKQLRGSAGKPRGKRTLRTRKGPSPAPTNAKGASSWPMAPFFSMRSARCRSGSKANCYACCRNANSSASAATARSSTCASSPPPTASSSKALRKTSFAGLVLSSQRRPRVPLRDREGDVHLLRGVHPTLHSEPRRSRQRPHARSPHRPHHA